MSVTIYAGEVVHIFTEALDYKGVAFTDEDAVTVTVTIWDLEDEILVDGTAMTFDATGGPEDEPGWLYHWSSPSGLPGTYLAAVALLLQVRS
mgnify:FL=1